MNYLSSNDIATTHMESEAQTSESPVTGLILRGVISGVVLAMTASRSGVPVSDESLVPIGFVIIMMLGLELLIGFFAVMAKRIHLKRMLQNWFWVVIGNGLGSVLYGLFFIANMTTLLTLSTNTPDKMIGMAEVKALTYAAHHGLDYIPNLMKCLLPS